MNATSSLSLVSMLVIGLAVAGTACAVEESEDGESADGIGVATSAQVSSSGGGTTGGACTVISGANKGKTGTFNSDGDCAGSWGMSECTNQDGTDSGKCKAGKVVIKRPPVYGGGSSGVVVAP